MTVSVDLTVAAKSGVVAVPTPALRGLASDEPWVWTVVDGRIRRQAVTVGIRGDGHTEVVDGLAPDTEVVLASSLVLADGQRVRTDPEGR